MDSSSISVIFAGVVLAAVGAGAVFLSPPLRGSLAAAQRTAGRIDTDSLRALVQQLPPVTFWRRRIYLRVWAAAARNPNCTAGLLAELTEAAAASPRDGGFLRRHIPPEKVSFAAVRQAVASNLNCGHETLVALASDPRVHIRGEVAANPHCPEAMIEQLVSDPSALVRRRIARRDSVTRAALMVLASDRNTRVRGLTADRADCPPEAFETLATDRKAIVRVLVARHESCPADLTAQLAADRCDMVRAVTAANPALMALETLAADRSVSVRVAAAGREDCPASLRVGLAGDRNTRVRAAIAANRSTPQPLLEALVCDRRGGVARQAGANPALGRGGVDAILECLA